MTTATDTKALVAKLRMLVASHDECYPDPLVGWSYQARALLSDAAEALSSSASSESPILAFHAWAERRTSTRRPLTQDEYFLAQEAFFAAHPGKGPQSSTMAASSETQEERPDRIRAAFEAGCHARPCGADGWAFNAPSTSQARAASEAYAAYVREAQSSPVPHEANNWQSIEALEDCDRLVWLWTPASRLGSGPDVKADVRLDKRRNWTWATKWQPATIPEPPVEGEA